jgi:hypothetical protein
MIFFHFHPSTLHWLRIRIHNLFEFTFYGVIAISKKILASSWCQIYKKKINFIICKCSSFFLRTFNFSCFPLIFFHPSIFVHCELNFIICFDFIYMKLLLSQKNISILGWYSILFWFFLSVLFFKYVNCFIDFFYFHYLTLH